MCVDSLLPPGHIPEEGNIRSNILVDAAQAQCRNLMVEVTSHHAHVQICQDLPITDLLLRRANVAIRGNSTQAHKGGLGSSSQQHESQTETPVRKNHSTFFCAETLWLLKR